MAKPRQNSSKRQSVKRLPTLEMLIDLTHFIMSVLGRLSFEQVQNLLKNKNTILRKKLMEVFEIVLEVDPFAEVREEWKKFYLDHFGFSGPTNFTNVLIPTKPSEGSWRLVFIRQGLTLNEIVAVMRSKFKVWVYNEDLDTNVTVNTRTSATSYAVWVQTGVEPDSKYIGKSTRVADMAGTIGVTLLERLVLELKYFDETSSHLDLKGFTLCTGSRYSSGDVPDVYFDPRTGEVCVCLYSLDGSHLSGGLREAVSR